jgi:Raf kinase inhibitor-like YbhB/YbcL family protein
MLQYLPTAFGAALRNMRPGTGKLSFNGAAFAQAPASLELTSTAFAPGGAIPARSTADGQGVSPPLAWSAPPPRATSFALLVEDADSPTPQPLVHAIVTALPSTMQFIVEGALPSPAGPGHLPMGRNSYFKQSFLPPDPPPGHGPHRYAFQLFALDIAPSEQAVGRGALLKAMAGHVLAKGMLIGIYERR